MNNFLKRLIEEDLHLIIMKDGKTVFTSNEEGMQPLFNAIDILGLSILRKSVIIDKVVGKAAAFLITYFEAREVHCLVLSVRALKFLDNHDIKYYAERVIPEIKNKFGTDICPFEKAVLDIKDLDEGYNILSAKLKSFRERQKQ